MNILDGVALSKKIIEEIKEEIEKNNYKITFCIIQIGNVFESNKYINNKLKKASYVGIKTDHKKYDNNISFEDLKKEINLFKNLYDGIIIQLPIPSTLNKKDVLDLIDVEKDVDGLTTKNKKNFINNEGFYFIPATAKAIITCLEENKIEIKNKKAYVIGESELVGNPTKILLNRLGAITRSFNIETGIKGSEEADILIVAAGCANLVKKENVKNGSTVIDVGINTFDENKIVGDVDIQDAKEKINNFSPSPGGIGPLTVCSLIQNIILAYKRKIKFQ
ncbi:MAG: tetrahydrofolate dehydrogenase/cyclohydrolase catalytic domain-containing protein [Metamycoplasmataceae bacterium]